LKKNGELIHVEVLNGQSSLDGQTAIIGTLLDISKRKQAEETIKHLAFHDPLTELPNRILFADRIQQALHRAERNKEKVALLFIDLDRFKSVNDSLGHAAGDAVLKEAAKRLQNCLRQADTVSRFGGDEFNVLLPQIGREEEVNMIAHKILKVLEWPYLVDDQEIFLSGSIGIALYPKDGRDAMSLTKNADTALYRAKDLGRNNYQPYSSAMNSRALERMALESSLRKVLDRQELRVFYQPQVDLQSGLVVGIEALMRWHHPTGRMIEPSVFIPLAEETGLIVPMGEWILRAACWQLKEWRGAGLQPLRLGVNVSSKQFQQTNLTELVCSILQETGLEASQINLEITETMIMSDVNESISVLQSLREVGVTIAIDDFGTGFSSLSYLKDFPADHLKIDRAFVQNLPFSKNEANIARHIIELAHSLGLKVIAEGVERNDQMEFLKTLGCDEIQGYFISPPLPAEEAFEFIKENLSLVNLDKGPATVTDPQDPAQSRDINR
jgi:diguanylate cyclase (GGDEF)-like protein